MRVHGGRDRLERTALLPAGEGGGGGGPDRAGAERGEDRPTEGGRSGGGEGEREKWGVCMA